MRCVAALHAGVLLVTLVPAPAGAQVTAPPLSAIETHDNLQPAGVLRNGELRLSLWAGLGRWSPKGPAVPSLTVAALGVEGRALSIPSPLIRVPVGTLVHASIRNTLASPLRVSGFCPRPGRCDLLVIAPGTTGIASFAVLSAGTFHLRRSVRRATTATTWAPLSWTSRPRCNRSCASAQRVSGRNVTQSPSINGRGAIARAVSTRGSSAAGRALDDMLAQCRRHVLRRQQYDEQMRAGARIRARRHRNGRRRRHVDSV